MVANVVTQAAKITVLRPIADGTLTVPGSTATVGATAIYSRRGPVGKVFDVTADTIEDITGKPFPMTEGPNAEGLRHTKDALDECIMAKLVRVVADDARFPSITLPLDSSDPVKADHAYGTDVVPGDGNYISIFPVDGDPCENRRFSIAKDETNELLDITFEEKVNGEWVYLESHSVSLNQDSRDDYGIPNFANAAFSQQSSRFGCVAVPGTDFSATSEVSEAEFEGGTNGGAPTVDNWKDAWEMLRSDDHEFDLGFMAGQYDGAVIAKALDVCDEKLAQLKADVPPWLTEEAGKEWVDDLNIDNMQIQFFHYPYIAYDEWYGTKSAWGLSGAAVASKAICYATVTGHAEVKGAHYTCAGEKRGRINRRNIEPITSVGKLSAEQLVDARINPADKGKAIGDSLNMFRRNNYLRFEHVVAINNAVMRDFVVAARYAKFEPDGLTQEILERLGTEVASKYRDAGAFVEPRDPVRDGYEPFTLKIEQQEFDLWKVTLYYSPTGVARRIALQSVLLK